MAKRKRVALISKAVTFVIEHPDEELTFGHDPDSELDVYHHLFSAVADSWPAKVVKDVMLRVRKMAARVRKKLEEEVGGVLGSTYYVGFTGYTWRPDPNAANALETGRRLQRELAHQRSTVRTILNRYKMGEDVTNDVLEMDRELKDNMNKLIEATKLRKPLPPKK